MKKVLKILMAFVLILSMFSGCGKPKVEEQKTSTSAKTIKVVDSRGKEVEVNYPAKKIVCLLNSGLNDLYMLGAKDQVVGIDEWTYSTKNIYEITSKIDSRLKDKSVPAVDKSIEKIVGMNPDAVIIWAGNNDTIKALEDKGVKVVGIQVNSFKEITWKMELLGKIVGKEQRAKEIVDYTKAEADKLQKVTSTVEDSKKLSAMFVWGPTKLDIAGNNSTGNSILTESGAKNSAASENQEHFVVPMEKVSTWNPDAIVMWNSDKLDAKDYFSDNQWTNIKAVKNKAVFELPDAFYCDLWTVKYIYSLKVVSKQLYPDKFKDMDLEKEKKDMLKFLYNTDL